MIQSPQAIQVSRDGKVHEATVAWERRGHSHYAVEISSPAFETVSAQADDAFEALCQVREQLEPNGWRVGVAGAQAEVWPSGMARDQGGGLVAYRMTPTGAGEIVDTFEPVDVATVVTVNEQRVEIARLTKRSRA